MRTLRTAFKTLILCLLFWSISGCELVGMAMEEAIDCVFRMSAQLDGRTLEEGRVGELYDEMLVASVKNTPNEHHFEYYFTISGDLPPGVQANVSDRKVFFRGVPQEAGNYQVNVHVDIEYTGNPEDERYCFSDPSLTRSYMIKIAPANDIQEILGP